MEQCKANTTNELTAAVLKVGDIQKALAELKSNLQKFQLKAMEIKDAPGFEAATVYYGLALAADVILRNMFVGFKMPKDVIDSLRGKEVVSDPDFVKGVAIN